MKSLIFVLALCSLFGCKKTEEENGKSILIKFEVKNNTSYDLKISLFRSNDSLFKDVQIAALDSLIIDEGFLHPAPGGLSYNITNSIDSGIIEFNDGKKLIQTVGSRGRNDTINNILLDRFYKNFESTNPDIVRKQFTIKNSDYLRAK
jgi:hypothetical protein